MVSPRTHPLKLSLLYASAIEKATFGSKTDFNHLINFKL